MCNSHVYNMQTDFTNSLFWSIVSFAVDVSEMGFLLVAPPGLFYLPFFIA